MRLKLGVGLQLLLLIALDAGALAQAEPLPELPPPPPPGAQPAAGAEGAAATPGADAACVPSCRSGFTCQSGVCISACNPPCPAGQGCTAQGECAYLTPQYPAPPLPTGYPIPGYQPAEPPPPGTRTHDGLMLRGTLGIGWNGINQSPEDDDNRNLENYLYGVSMALSVDVGFAPVEDFSMHLRFGLAMTPSPEVDSENDVYEVDENAGYSVNTLLVAAGLTYYFMPINIYLTGAAGLAWLTFDDSGRYRSVESTSNASSDVGIGLNLDVGKEWWVGRQWGLGTALRTSYTGVSGEIVSGNYDYAAWGVYVLFSVTLQ